MAATPNFGISLDFAHSFLTEVDFSLNVQFWHPSNGDFKTLSLEKNYEKFQKSSS